MMPGINSLQLNMLPKTLFHACREASFRCLHGQESQDLNDTVVLCNFGAQLDYTDTAKDQQNTVDIQVNCSYWLEIG